MAKLDPRLNLLPWALYDAGNSAFSAVIQTFVYATYFTEQVAPNKDTGTALWGATIGGAGVIIALSAPFLGAIADHSGHHKRWIAPLTLLCIVATASMWFVQPNERSIPLGLFLAAVGTIGAELAFVFYNGMLPHLAPKQQLTQWSAWGYSSGYLGGLLCLILTLFLFVTPHPSWYGAHENPAQQLRLTFPLVAAWYALFSIPLFVWLPDDRIATGAKSAIRKGLQQIVDTVHHLRRYRLILRFLIARMFYADGLATIFAFGGIIAAGLFGMNEKQVLLFGIVLNIVAGTAAGAFALLASRISARTAIIVSLCGLTLAVWGILTTHSVTNFWGFGIIIGALVGPTQAASRAYLAHLAPSELSNQMFGFYALSGKATTFIGPLAVGWLTYLTDSQRFGVGVSLVFLLIGLVIFATLPKETHAT